jgi:hypothetical protein
VYVVTTCRRRFRFGQISDGSVSFFYSTPPVAKLSRSGKPVSTLACLFWQVSFGNRTRALCSWGVWDDHYGRHASGNWFLNQTHSYGLFKQSDRLCCVTQFSQIGPILFLSSNIFRCRPIQFSLISVELCKYPITILSSSQQRVTKIWSCLSGVSQATHVFMGSGFNEFIAWR